MPEIWNKFKVWIVAVVAPLAFALGYIWVLLNKKQKLEDEVAQSHVEKELAGNLTKLSDQKKVADDAEEKFDNALDSFDSTYNDYKRKG